MSRAKCDQVNHGFGALKRWMWRKQMTVSKRRIWTESAPIHQVEHPQLSTLHQHQSYQCVRRHNTLFDLPDPAVLLFNGSLVSRQDACTMMASFSRVYLLNQVPAVVIAHPSTQPIARS